MSDESAFIDIIGFGHTVDIMPKIKEAMPLFRYKHDLTPAEVAEMVKIAARSDRFPAAFVDRVEGGMLGELTRPVIQWVQSEHRIAQVTDPDVRLLRPYIELTTGPYYCKAVKALSGRWLQPEELVRLPLMSCDVDRCTCRYGTQSRRDVEQRGVQPGGCG